MKQVPSPSSAEAWLLWSASAAALVSMSGVAEILGKAAEEEVKQVQAVLRQSLLTVTSVTCSMETVITPYGDQDCDVNLPTTCTLHAKWV